MVKSEWLPPRAQRDTEAQNEGRNPFQRVKQAQTRRRRDFPAVTGNRIPVFLHFERGCALRSAVRGVFSSAVSIDGPVGSIARLSVAIAEMPVSIARLSALISWLSVAIS